MGPAASKEFENPEILVEFKGRDQELLLERNAELLLALEHIALRWLWVRETHAPFRFNAMSSRERRILHLVLKEEPGVRSESEGSGEERQVIVYPVS
jgi:predicted RNA-binding protein Jag